jgi:transformation/transcription domain-associated protein
MYGYNAMEVQEAFVKIKEQARAYLTLPHDLTAGESWTLEAIASLMLL